MSFLPDIAYAVAFSYIVQFDASQLRAVKERFGTLEDAWRASGSAFLSIGFRQSFVDRFLEMRDDIHPEDVYTRMRDYGIDAVMYDDPRYPTLLSQTVKYPALLYCRGTLSLDDLDMVVLAVVGTRKATSYGTRVVQHIVSPLVQRGYVIVSGLAYGIDTCAHECTLSCGGITIAVLAGGIDDESVYPKENRVLAQRITENGGCILSEYPIGTQPKKEHFPLRNRIVSGMSNGVLVAEAPEKSGALITAFLALDQNREVCAVPGPITHGMSAGANMLLKLGAHVVTSADDIIRVFGGHELTQQSFSGILPALSDIQQRVYDVLSAEPMYIDDICEVSQLDIQTVNSTLGIMELNGLITNVGRVNYVRNDLSVTK